VSVNGVRVCGDAVQLMLQPLQATSSPK